MAPQATTSASPSPSHSSASTSLFADRDPSGSTIPDPASVEDYGRTYHAYKEGKYFMPNDAAEQERLDLQHALWGMIMDGELSWAPFTERDPPNVLDIGTGTGIWAICFARAHPASHVTGTDLSLTQPKKPPSNCTFIREDSEDEWLFESPFDYVHLRLMCTCFNDCPGVMRRIFDNLKPGGWVEFQECTFSVITADETTRVALDNDPYSFRTWTRKFVEGAKALGRDIEVTPKIEGWLREAGFVNVVEKQVPVPCNGWPVTPKDQLTGTYSEQNFLNGIESPIKLFLAAGMSEDEVRNELIPGAERSMKDHDLHAYTPWYVIYARRPLDGEDVES